MLPLGQVPADSFSNAANKQTSLTVSSYRVRPCNHAAAAFLSFSGLPAWSDPLQTHRRVLLPPCRRTSSQKSRSAYDNQLLIHHTNYKNRL